MDRRWDTNHAGYRAIFNAALTGICANSAFFGAVMQGCPTAAVAFADEVVAAAIRNAEPIHRRDGDAESDGVNQS